MEKIKAIIVDDEPEAREIMERLLQDFGEVEVVSSNASVGEAFASVVKYNPDLVFLDIDMPVQDGFVLIEMLRKTQFMPTFIFVTAYNQFAIEAIKHAAFDYLLKPVDIDELKRSISRYREQFRSETTLSRIERLLISLQEEKIHFNTRTGTIYLNPADVIYCEADGNYSTLFLAGDARQTVTMNIGRLEEVLPVDRFAKISRSVIINKSYLSEINRKEKVCKLKVRGDCITLHISRRYLNVEWD